MSQQRDNFDRNSEDDNEAPLLGQSTRTRPNTWQEALAKKGVQNGILGGILLILIIILIFLTAIWGRGSNSFSLPSQPESVFPLSKGALHYGWNQCKRIEELNIARLAYFSQQNSTSSKMRSNPRAEAGPAIVIRSVTIWNGVGKTYKADVLLKGGIIADIGHNFHIPKDAKIIQGRNKILTPGIVDMHSHIGVDSWPEMEGSDDTNEMTQPAYPQLRTLDGFNPNDMAIPRVVSGGVTTALVLPGSGNLMGGEAFVFKLRPIGNLTVESMLAQAGVSSDGSDGEFKWRYMKFACGENPKRVYSSKGRSPTTRMGSAYIMREMFKKAAKLKHQQDDWCDYVEDHFSEQEIHSGTAKIINKFPEDLKLESLSNVLRGNVQPHIHCYETEDLETLVRISEEFHFQIWAFHHALEAYKVPDLIHRAGRNGFNVTIATFSDGWGYKKEAYNGSPAGPLILASHNIPVAFKSDHPVINSQHLMYEATKAYNAGLDPSLALAAVTSVPAKALGLSHRIGSIAIGMDADVVLWDQVPFIIGAHPIQVFIDGIAQIPEQNSDKDFEKNNAEEYDISSPNPMPSVKNNPIIESQCKNVKTFVIEGLEKMIFNKTHQFSTLNKNNLKLVVHDGSIICAAESCLVELSELKVAKKNIHHFDMGGHGWLVPGLVGVGTKLGLNEIIQEYTTGDGLNNKVVAMEDKSYPDAQDGLHYGGKHLDRAFRGGVTTAISAPLSESGVVSGFSVAFYTDGTQDYRDISKPVASLHVQIGSNYFNKKESVSGQINLLKRAFLKAIECRGSNLSRDNSSMAKALRGEIPVVVKVHNADDISHLIRLKKTIRSALHQLDRSTEKLGLDLIILGGAESWIVADQLAHESIPVILQPARCVPDSWSKRRCLPGPPLSADSTFTALYRAGVEVGLAADEDAEYMRDLIWDASWAYNDANGNLTEIDAIGLVSWNLASMFHLEDQTSFTITSGNPLDSSSKPSLIWSARAGLTCL